MAYSFAPNAALKSAQFDFGLCCWSPLLGLSGSLVQSPPVSIAETPDRSSAVAMSVRQDIPPACTKYTIQLVFNLLKVYLKRMQKG